MATEEDDSVEAYLDRALEHAENEETQYWIRTALQHLVADRDAADSPP